MELLKQSIDKVSFNTKLFSDTKWVITFEDIQCDTPNSSNSDDDFIINVSKFIPKEPIKHTFKKQSKDIQHSKDIQQHKDIQDSKEQKDIQDLTGNKQEIKINKIETKNISPLEFFKQSLDLYEDNDIIKNKIFIFIATQKITNKYTKRGISLIMDGITQDKWNIYICKLFSFLLDISFEYRKQNICETQHSKFIIKK